MHIKVINLASAQNLMDRMRSGNWIILYYADWCGHCQDFKPEWERLKSMVPPHINTAEAESEIIPQMPMQPNIQGYPTMKLYTNNRDLGDYSGERSSAAILTHLKKVMTAAPVQSSSKKSRHTRRRTIHRAQFATTGVINEMKLESKRLKELLRRTKVLNPARMHTPTQAVKYLEGSLRKSMKKTQKRVRRGRGRRSL